ncbi:hypothetical protein L2E82_16695 [Cichorium intybus]|uniref:Uncharacterized protein n=1 Tax=Cichorium intybus TaxID=13427 RepID=A0ACB9F5L1_CICIN|nr:hypothetical protein L2E82_16695 [Cichorium intybus]
MPYIVLAAQFRLRSKSLISFGASLTLQLIPIDLLFRPADACERQVSNLLHLYLLSHYVAEVQRKDWKKCCPFHLSGDSAESNYQREMVLASVLLEDSDALVNTPANTEALNCVIIDNDATSTIKDRPLETASSKAAYAYCQIEKIIYGDTVATENDKRQHAVVIGDSVKNIIDGASKSSSSKLKNDVRYQNENSILKDTIDAGTNYISDGERNLEGAKPGKFRLLSDILKELDGPSDAPGFRNGDIEFTSESEDDSDDDFTLETVVRKKKGIRVISKSGVKSKNQKMISEVLKPSFDRDIMMKHVSGNTCGKDPKRGSKRQLRKTRTRETEDDSDHDFTPETVVRKKKAVQVTSKSGIKSKNEKRILEVLKPSFDQAKRMKPVLGDSCGKVPKRGSKHQLIKTRTTETVDDSDDDFTPETIVRKKKDVRVISKSGIESKNKMRISEVLKPSFDWGKRMKPVSENSCGKDSQLGSKHQLRKTRTSETEDDSDDDFTLEKVVRKKKGVRVISKSGIEPKNKKRILEVLKPSVNHGKRMKPVSENSCRKDPQLGSKHQQRKTRTSETEDDSDDDFTLEKVVRKKKGVRVIYKSGTESKNRKRISEVLKASFERGKRMKRVSENSCGKDPQLGSKRQLRKTRTEVDLRMMNKAKEFEAENMVAPSSLGGGENTPGTQEDSLISRGNKRNREVLKLLDGSKMRSTNSSRSTHATSYNMNRASCFVQKSIMESSPPIVNESMAALQLLGFFNAGVNTQTLSKTATKDPALSVSKGKIMCGLDEIGPPASGSIVCQSLVEVNVINGAPLLQAEQTASGTSVCLTNVNPSEFSIPNARKFLRRARFLQN